MEAPQEFEPGEQVGYLARISKLEDRKEAEKLASQDNAVLGFLALKKVNLKPECHFREVGSAYTRPIADRQVLQDILSKAKSGAFSVLALFKLDRLSRSDPIMAVLYIRQLNELGVKVYSYCEGWVDCSDPMKQLQVFILLTIAYMESYNTSIRTKAKLALNRKEGKPRGGIDMSVIPEETYNNIIADYNNGYTILDTMNHLNVPERWVRRARARGPADPGTIIEAHNPIPT